MSLVPPNYAKIKCPQCSSIFYIVEPRGTKYNCSDGGKITSREYFLCAYKVPHLGDYALCTNDKFGCYLKKDSIKRDITIRELFGNSDRIEDIPENVKRDLRSKVTSLDKTIVLLKTKDFSHYKEKDLIILYWGLTTDTMLRTGYYKRSLEKVKKQSMSVQTIEYVDKLLNMLNLKDDLELLFSIEINRSIGRFDKAEKLLKDEWETDEFIKIAQKEKSLIINENMNSFFAQDLPQIIY